MKMTPEAKPQIVCKCIPLKKKSKSSTLSMILSMLSLMYTSADRLRNEGATKSQNAEHT